MTDPQPSFSRVHGVTVLDSYPLTIKANTTLHLLSNSSFLFTLEKTHESTALPHTPLKTFSRSKCSVTHVCRGWKMYATSAMCLVGCMEQRNCSSLLEYTVTLVSGHINACYTPLQKSAFDPLKFNILWSLVLPHPLFPRLIHLSPIVPSLLSGALLLSRLSQAIQTKLIN